MVLLHGLWMRRPALWPLARRLGSAGFAPQLFAYATLLADPQDSLARLAALVRNAGPGPVHLVGHSLGGVTALALLQAHPDLPPGRVVCIGSPLAGSHAARRLRALGLAWLGGRSRALLEQGVSPPPGREVGMIAGTRCIGAGRWLGRFDGENDGTVSVAETRIAGLADHVRLAHSHTGLLFARDVAFATSAFLRTGRFA